MTLMYELFFIFSMLLMVIGALVYYYGERYMKPIGITLIILATLMLVVH